ncbi:MAG: hypothetical protein EB023_10160, partial [Flavobacteriia bacterium]|nr:hypothetical protein [Flavobacteriia bacterium]
ISAGTYSVTVTDANGCTRTGSINLVNPPALNLTANVTSNYNGQQISCTNSTNGTASASVTGGVPTYTYLWSNGATTPNVTGLASGTYTVTITDANGCTQNQSITVSPPNPLSPTPTITSNFNGFNVSCFGSNNGSASVNVSGGTPGYTYFWSNFSTLPTASNLSAGTYTVTVTDANGCTANSSVTLTNPPQLNVSAVVTSNYNGFNVSCFGSNNGSALATATGGVPAYAYSWNNGTNTAVNNNLNASQYIVTVTDLNGCIAIDTVTLTQPTPIIISSVNQNVSCFGGSNGAIDATISGGVIPYTYLWSNGAVTQDINSLTAGTYNLTLTDANGCSQPFTTTITQPNNPIILTESHANVTCFGLSNGSINLTVTGGTAPYSYVWNSGPTSQDVFNLPAGNYSVVVTDINGCIANLAVAITQPLAPLSNTAVVSSANCFGQSSGSINLTVNGGTAPYVYSWNNGAFTEDLSNVGSGNYTVNITDNNGCTSSGSYTIGQPALPLAISETHQDILCFGTSSGSINLTVSGGTAPYTYLWNNGSVIEDLVNIPAGTYTVTVTDANGCTSTTTVTLSQLFAPLSLAEVHTNVACFQGNTGFIDLTVTGGAPNYTYVWSNGGVTQDIGQLPAGNYSVTVTDLYGCTSSLSVTLTQPATPILLTETHVDNSCSAGTTGSINLTVSGGVGPYSYVWNNGANSQDILNLQSGNYTVQVTDALGCLAILTVTIADPANGIAVTGNITPVDCFGNGTGAVNITVSGGQPAYSYLWSNGAITQDISSLVANTYSVNVTDQTGCQYFISFLVDQPDSALTFIPTIQNVVCYGQNTGNIYMNVWGGTPPYTFNWSNGNTTQSNFNLIAGTYS